MSNQATLAAHQRSALNSCLTDKHQLTLAVGKLETDKQRLQAHMAALQADKGHMHRQQQVWAWRLAELLHWRQSGCAQLRRMLRAWALVTSVAAHTDPHENAQGYAAGKAGTAEAESQQLSHGRGHHDWQLLGCCFRGQQQLLVSCACSLTYH